MPQSLAVQLKTDAVVLAMTKGSGEEAALAELALRQPSEGQSPLDLAVAMTRERRMENIGLALLLNWQDYSLRDAWLPFTNLAQIKTTIKFELEEDLDLAADEALMPFQVMEQRAESSHILVWAARKEAVADILGHCEKSGISPEYMPPDAVGHIGLVEALAPDLRDQPVAVLSGDEHGADLTLQVGRQLWARCRLASLASPQASWEIRRTFLSIPSFPQPHTVVSFGPEDVDALARAVAEDLGCPHRAVPPPKAAGLADLSYWPLAAGVALLMARGGERPLTFRVEEFEPKESGEAASLLSLVATALLGVLLLVGGFFFHLKVAPQVERAAYIESQVAAFWQAERFPPAQMPEVANLENALTGLTADTQRRLDAARGRPNALKRFRSLATAMAGLPDSVTLDLGRLDISSDNIAISGTANSYEAASALTQHINDKAKEFQAETESIVPQPEGKAKFNLRISYKDQKKENRP